MKLKIVLLCLLVMFVVSSVVADDVDVAINVKLNEVSKALGDARLVGPGDGAQGTDFNRDPVLQSIFKSEDAISALFSSKSTSKLTNQEIARLFDTSNKKPGQVLTNEQKSQSLQYMEPNQIGSAFGNEQVAIKLPKDAGITVDGDVVRDKNGKELFNKALVTSGAVDQITVGNFGDKYKDYVEFRKGDQRLLVKSGLQVVDAGEKGLTVNTLGSDGSVQQSATVFLGGEKGKGIATVESTSDGRLKVAMWNEAKVTFSDGSTFTTSNSWETKLHEKYGEVIPRGDGVYEFIGEGTLRDEKGALGVVRNLGSESLIAATRALSSEEIKALGKGYISFARGDDGITIATQGASGQISFKVPNGDFTIAEGSDRIGLFGEDEQYMAVVDRGGETFEGAGKKLEEGTYVPRTQASVEDSGRVEAGEGPLLNDPTKTIEEEGLKSNEEVSVETESGEVTTSTDSSEGVKDTLEATPAVTKVEEENEEEEVLPSVGNTVAAGQKAVQEAVGRGVTPALESFPEMRNLVSLDFNENKYGQTFDDGASYDVLAVEFYGPTCGNCVKMDNKIKEWGTQSGVEQWGQKPENLFIANINGDANPLLRKKYGVSAYPTTLFLKRDGTLVSRVQGYMSPPIIKKYYDKTINQK